MSSTWTKVAESKFLITVQEFFSFFYSDDAFGFLESYHQSCGDKDFKCSLWHPHEKIGNARDVSFQHPIKLYLGAKCGTCREVQKYRVYKNSHLVIETSQNVTDVPYGDYFHVEGLWDVERDGDDSRRSCIVRVYVNVVFSKKTMFKGKIVQSTIDEARDAYDIWIKNAHKLLKQKKLEEEDKATEGRATNSIVNGQVCDDTQVRSGGTLERPEPAGDIRTSTVLVGPKDDSDPTCVTLPGSFNMATSLALFWESMSKFYASLKSRSQIPLVLVIAFALILLLMQLTIIVLLSRPQRVQLVPHLDYSSSSSERKYEMMAWMDKRIQYFKEEMLMVESLIEKMRHEHKLLKAQLDDLERFRRLQMD